MTIIEPDDEGRISLLGISDPLAARYAVSINARGVIRLFPAPAIEKLERRLEAITPGFRAKLDDAVAGGSEPSATWDAFRPSDRDDRRS